MTELEERDWLVEPSIARGALTLVSGAHALDVALALAASVSRGWGLPRADGWPSDFSVLGRVLVCRLDDSAAWLEEADADRAHALEIRDAEGNGRPFALTDVRMLWAEFEQRRATLVVLAEVEPDVLAELAHLAEVLDGAFIAICTDAHVAQTEIAHSALEAVEVGRECYALVHRASRIGPLGPALAFSTWLGSIQWEGLAGPHAVEAALELEARAVEGGSDSEPQDPFLPFLPSLPSPDAALEVADTDLQVVDAESAFLLEQLAHGPMRARDVQRRGAEQGFGVRTLRRRAEALGIERRKSGLRGPWMWLPPAGVSDEHA